MEKIKEFRFETILGEDLLCEVYLTYQMRNFEIKTVNVIGDCVVTFDDLDEVTKKELVKKVHQFFKEMGIPF